jgi:alpha-glucoside transport system substrate-binding protein
VKKIIITSAVALSVNFSIAQAEQVTVFGPWLGPDQENVEAVLSAFASVRS